MRCGRWVLFEKFVIGPANDPYMIRWRIFECPWFRVFFHRILRDDADRHLHDHPFNFRSLIVRGGYTEHHQFGEMKCCPGMVIYRSAEWLHRITLHRNPDGTSREAWTLVLAGRRLRDWGFQTEEGWVHWKQYTGEAY